MGAAYFYHLTQSGLTQTLASLIEKSRGAGWRVVVRARSDQMVDRLDADLWKGAPEGFLPHGMAGAAFEEEQPVLLTTGMSKPNGASCLMSVEGAMGGAAEVTDLQRVCVIFDGDDPQAVQSAREQWKALTAAGCAAQYWSEASGRWSKQAESGG